MKWFAIIFFMLCLTVSVGANPFLVAEPTENPDYYVVKINGDAKTVSPFIDDILMYDLESLDAGMHEVSISVGGNIEGTSKPVNFQIHKVVNKNWTHYEIQIMTKDPQYLKYFSTPLKVKVRTETQTKTGSWRSSGCS